MDETNRTAYAFPIGTADQVFEPGMTMRDYFAAKAMAAQIVAVDGLDRGNNNQALDLAAFSYAMADAMLQARDLA